MWGNNMAMSSLTAIERETVITMNDAEDYMEIRTEQRPMINALKKNPAATLVDEGKFGLTLWAAFQIPKGLLTIRKGKKIASAKTKKALAAGVKCSATTAAGKPCQGKAINETGKCFKHQS
jgi:UDP-N-acetylglucosamine pyrophosphorylase